MHIDIVIPSLQPDLCANTIDQLAYHANHTERIQFNVVAMGPEWTPECMAIVRSSAWDMPVLFMKYPENLGVLQALQKGYEGTTGDILAFFHDDTIVKQDDWDTIVLEHFAWHEKCGVIGFGGARGFATPDIYIAPYDFRQLARQDFGSNMEEADAHGRRIRRAERSAVVDGFAMIWRSRCLADIGGWPIELLSNAGFHGYDNASCLLAIEKGWEVWTLPVECHHLGGRTAVKYQPYKDSELGKVERELWLSHHEVLAKRFRNLLPIRVTA